MIAAFKYRRCRSSIVLGILISYNYLLSVRWEVVPDPPVRFQTSKWMDPLDVAEALFQERGYTAVAMRDIAEGGRDALHRFIIIFRAKRNYSYL